MSHEIDPAARQWLAADLGARTARVVVAGVSGGVGTTTLAALVAHAVAQARPGRVQLVDHTGGTLAERAGAAPGGEGWAGPARAQVSVECAGASALLPGDTAVRASEVVPVVVAPWHPAGLRLAERAAAALPGALVVAMDTTGSHPRTRSVESAHGVPHDLALAVPGAFREAALAAPTAEAVVRITVDALARTHAAGGAPPTTSP